MKAIGLVGLVWKDRGEAVHLAALTECLICSHRLQGLFLNAFSLTIFPQSQAVGSFAISHLFLTSSQSLLYILFCRLFASKATINRGHYCKRKGHSLQPQAEAMQTEALYIHFSVIAYEVCFLHFWSGCPQFRRGTVL